MHANHFAFVGIFLPDVLSEWGTKLEDERDDMAIRLSSLQAGGNPRLHAGVIHAKALGKIDLFLKACCKLCKESCFRPLCDKYQK